MATGIMRLRKLLGRASECERFREMASLYLEQDLPEDLREQIQDHLKACENCEGFFATLQETITMLHTLPRQKIPEELKHTLFEICEEKGLPESKS